MTISDLTHFFDLQNLSNENNDSEEVCIANISPLERKKRLRFGIQQLIFTLVLLVLLILLHVHPLWRLTLLFMFWAAAIGYFQARDKT